MSIRRFRIKKIKYEQVKKWLQDQDEKEDEHTMPAEYLPDIAWAHKAPMRIKKVEHGRNTVEAKEGGSFKRIIHESEIDDYLRTALLSRTSDVPMSRDSGYYIVQKRTLGISRRVFAKFLQKQAVLQITRNALPKMKRVSKRVEQRGNLEVDLVEAKGKDIGVWVHRPIKNFYFITLIDRLTGWLEVGRITKKDFAHVVPAFKEMVLKMQKALRVKVTYIRSDSGSEFKSETQKMLKDLNIRHKFVKSGSRLEQANRTYQRIFYRLMRLGRGNISELQQQAVGIFNNTKSVINGRTPLEALDTPDADLAAFVKIKKKPKYIAEEIVKGDKIRYLLDSVRGKHRAELGYKTYRGKHWSADIYKVIAYSKQKDSYYVASSWRTRDKLLKVPGVDKKTNAIVDVRHKKAKRGFKDEDFEWD